MRKLLCLVAGLVGLGLGASACNPVTPYAAVVNGTSISTAQVDMEMQAIKDNPTLRGQVEQPGSGITITGAGPGTFDTSFASQVLSRQIEFTVLEQEMARHHVRVTPADLRAAREDILNGGEFPPTGAGAFASLPADYQSVLVRRQADLNRFGAALGGVDISPGAISAYMAQHAADLQNVCAEWIQVGSAADAATVEADLKAGTSFSAEAQAKSQDQNTSSQGGQLGCHAGLIYGQLGAAVEKAVTTIPVGQPSPPVSSAQGLVIIEVTSRTPLSPSVAESNARQTLIASGQNQIGQEIEPSVTKADVVVDARYGRWVRTGSNGPQVVPPRVPAPRSG